jgi:transcriptional regulator with GAF, ATPase, and Fis domain
LPDPPALTWESIRAAGEQARRAAEAGPLALALERHDWSLARTARALDVDVDTLRRHIERHHPALRRLRRKILDGRAKIPLA